MADRFSGPAGTGGEGAGGAAGASCISDLRDRWHALCARVGAFGKAEEADLTFEMILTMYAHPPRAYHNLEHIRQCLGVFDEVKLLASARDEMEFALWLHDSVFIPERPDNERRSEEAAGMIAGLLGCAPAFAAEVRGLIAVTRHDVPPGRGDPAIAADIDLSILGTPWEQYSVYRHAIRAEFSFAGDEMFRIGRSAFLARMLERARIFHTPWFHSRYEEEARANMQRELDELSRRG